eukprot:scaffold218004_cov18-Tisochrysis_lutea.AAC.3
MSSVHVQHQEQATSMLVTPCAILAAQGQALLAYVMYRCMPLSHAKTRPLADVAARADRD